MKASHARLAAVVVLALGLAGCWSIPDASPAGTVVGTWKYDGKGTPSAPTTPHTDAITTAGGMGLELQWSSGTVTFPDGAKREVPLDLKMVVKTNPNGWHAPSTSAAPSFLVNDPLNMMGDAPGVMSADVTVFVNRGHRRFASTQFDNEELMVRLHGDGRAMQLKEVATGPNSSTWQE